MADMTVEQALDCMAGFVKEWGHAYHAEALATLRAELDGLRANRRAWAAEEMRGLVAGEEAPLRLYRSGMAISRVWNACRAETLANIERWENSHE